MKNGDLLYRAVDKNELGEILESNNFLIRDNTNFGDHIGPQVEEYSQSEDYAGVVIRFKVAGPYYRDAGMAVRRVTSIVPHFVKIEIKLGDEWVSVDEYKKRTKRSL